jgi:hypothetical protein
VRDVDNLTTIMCLMSWKSVSLNLLEPSGLHCRVPVIMCSNVKGLSGQGISLTVETDHVTVGLLTKLQTREAVIVTE